MTEWLVGRGTGGHDNEENYHDKDGEDKIDFIKTGQS